MGTPREPLLVPAGMASVGLGGDSSAFSGVVDGSGGAADTAPSLGGDSAAATLAPTDESETAGKCAQSDAVEPVGEGPQHAVPSLDQTDEPRVIGAKSKRGYVSSGNRLVSISDRRWFHAVQHMRLVVISYD